MKTFASFAVMVFAGVSPAPCQALRDSVFPDPVRASTRLQLTAKLDETTVKVGEPVVLRARYKNVSATNLELGTRYWVIDYGLVVTDSSGAEPPRTELGEKWLKEQREPVLLSSQGPFLLEPGAQGEEFAVDVTKAYRLTRPGSYSVQLMFRMVWPEPGTPVPTTVEESQKMPLEEAVSNVIQLTITP